MVIIVFGDTVLKPGKEQAEAKLVEQLDPIVRAMPGFISNNAYVGENGEEIGIIRFDSRKSLDEWMQQSLHAEFQKKMAGQIYERFWIQTAETYREYTWVNGKHTDGDLTRLFIER
jgi:antibiotic biosynthesis monooxygenase (ABM) superfamily enzyme